MRRIRGISDKWWKVDEYNSDDEYVYVDVEGLGTVLIKRETDRLVVEIYPIVDIGRPVASTWALYEDLNFEDEDIE